MVGLLIGLFFLGPVFCQAQNERPNIIYIMADDLGYADLSCFGNKTYQTPNIDKLALQGVKFMNAYSAAPVCTPTRTSFITGRYPARTPVGLIEPLNWTAKDSTRGLTPEYPSIATYLKQAGYETFLVGKWHLGFSPDFSPTKNGFDYFYGMHGGGVDYVSHRAPNGGANDLYENEISIHRDGYLTDLLKDKAIELINKPHDKPFFMALMFNAPHWPWQAPGDPPYPDTMDWKKAGSAKTYAAMMKSLDDAVGSVMQTLTAANLEKNTVVVFTSDNGGEMYSDMGKYKGEKMQLWEGGIRIPAIAYWPGKIKPGTVTNQVTITMDWTTSFLALAGAKLPDAAIKMDGMDIMNIIRGRSPEVNRTLYWRLFQRAQYKAMRNDQWKYLQDGKGDEYLFNLATDPSESIDMKEKEKSIFEGLKKNYAAWEATVLTPMPLK
jgi:arylsulfatase A-like enzyme